MSDFQNFYLSLLDLVKSYEEKHVHLKVEYDEESDLIKVFGERITSLLRAKNGLEDVQELSYTTAEHHPYWNLLYSCSQISKILLDNWESSLSEEDISEIKWSLKELEHTIEKTSFSKH